jgi:hypothetical protein
MTKTAAAIVGACRKGTCVLRIVPQTGKTPGVIFSMTAGKSTPGVVAAACRRIFFPRVGNCHQ